MKVTMIIVVFLLLNAFFIISNNNLDLKQSEDIKLLFSTYFSWAKNTLSNFGNITSNAIKLEWTPGIREA